ncbi:RNA-binding (RRM/RBD/RNP motifs) family protein isoform X2 [Carex rostrata]
MPRYRDEPAAVRVYTVCDESKYLIVRNVPSLGCEEELKKLFESYGPVEECKPMDAEDCEPYTDVFFIKFSQVSNARFSKRKLDESVFLGNRIQVTYAPHFETLSDTKEKLEARRREVLGRINTGRTEGAQVKNCLSNKRGYGNASQRSSTADMVYDHVPSNKDYFPSVSMNATVNLVRDKLEKNIAVRAQTVYQLRRNQRLTQDEEYNGCCYLFEIKSLDFTCLHQHFLYVYM